jgi:hypothetical protein
MFPPAMSIPVEFVHIPPMVKQELLNLNEFIFPPSNPTLFIDLCQAHGLPRSEALRFVSDALVGLPNPNPSKFINICGPPASGKSFYCHNQIANIFNEKPSASILYLDCDGSFSPHSVKPCFTRSVDALERIHVVRCFSWTAAVSVLHVACSLPELDMLVIDSIASILRYEENRFKILRTIFKLVSQLTATCKCIVVNQTTTGEGRIIIPFMHRAYERIIKPYGVTHF